jgi:hypothetical protein
MTDEQLNEAAATYKEYGSIRAAAREAGLPYSTMHGRIKRAAERGLLGYAATLPGFRVAQVTNTPRGDFIQQRPEHGGEFAMPAGHVAKGVSALVDADGRIIQQWVKTRQDGGVDWPDVFRDAFIEFEGVAEPIRPPTVNHVDLLNLIPANDWHVNMLCWQREVGENWDLKIAERIIGDAIDDAIGRTRSAGIAIVLGGGDILHSDDNTNRTAKSGNVLEADGRHRKALETAQRLLVRTIDATLRNNQNVIVRILQGNHDEYSSVAISYFLAAWYRNESRVSVDLDASLFYWHRFGSVFLGATHGHTVKLTQMPMIMAHRRAEDWGASKYRYIHGFHVHHSSKVATEGNGVICESHEAPIPQDAWHYGAGYLSGRCVKTITYHKDYGEVSRVRVAIPNGAGNVEREAA